MLENLKALFGFNDGPVAAPARRTTAGPFGLGLGRAVSFDVTFLKLAGPSLAMGLPPASMVITGHGFVDLGQGSLLHRFYDDEDRMLQVVCNGSVDEVQEVMWLRPWDNVVPATLGEWQAWAGEGGKIGRQTYDADGAVFERVWGDPRTPWIPAVEFVEDVTVDEGPARSIHQKSMAYRRTLPSGIVENLIIIVERDLASRDPGDISFMLGYGLAPADITPV